MQCVHIKREPVAHRYLLGLEVGVFAEDGEVVRFATPAGPVAWTTHLGPYNGLAAPSTTEFG
jgi:hypothetical protein